jgi:hypothetical protein
MNSLVILGAGTAGHFSTANPLSMASLRGTLKVSWPYYSLLRMNPPMWLCNFFALNGTYYAER